MELTRVPEVELETLLPKPLANLGEGVMALLDLWRITREQQDLRIFVAQILFHSGGRQDPPGFDK